MYYEKSLPEVLRDLSRQMESGEFSASTGAIFITIEKHTGILTICTWGDADGLLAEAMKARGDLAA